MARGAVSITFNCLSGELGASLYGHIQLVFLLSIRFS